VCASWRDEHVPFGDSFQVYQALKAAECRHVEMLALFRSAHLHFNSDDAEDASRYVQALRALYGFKAEQKRQRERKKISHASPAYVLSPTESENTQ
jgi:dipeptidyl aminopeptidase/acylaminoacyl peptidase